MTSSPLSAGAPPSIDAAPLEALRRGEISALSEVYRCHAPGLRLLARRLLGSASEADDLVQDLFVGLPEALERYEERGRFGEWLRRIVVRLALMRQRSGRRRRESPLELVTASARPRTPDPTARLSLSRVLATLPEEQRMVVVLRAIEGYSHVEVAELLGVRRNTVEVRYHRALQRLRQMLEDER